MISIVRLILIERFDRKKIGESEIFKKWASAEKLKVGDIEKKCSGEN